LHHPYSASRFHFNEQICNFTAWSKYKWCQNAQSSNLSHPLLNVYCETKYDHKIIYYKWIETGVRTAENDWDPCFWIIIRSAV
jgi:hypothetical protein